MAYALEYATLNYWVSCQGLRRSLERSDNGTADWFRQKLIIISHSHAGRLAGAADRGLKLIVAAHSARTVCQLAEYRR